MDDGWSLEPNYHEEQISVLPVQFLTSPTLSPLDRKLIKEKEMDLIEEQGKYNK